MRTKTLQFTIEHQTVSFSKEVETYHVPALVPYASKVKPDRERNDFPDPNNNPYEEPEEYCYDPAPQSEIDQHAVQTAGFGGFRAVSRSNPRDETINYIKDQLRKAIHRKRHPNVNIRISFMPEHTWWEVFPPTTSWPFGWKRHETSG